MKKFMIILVLMVLIGASCFVGGVYYGHELMDSNGNKESDVDKDTKKTTKEEEKESEKESKKEEVDNTPKKEIWSNDSYKVELQ